jgi:hypothetical protein
MSVQVSAQGINISLKRIERLTYYFGQLGIDLRENKLNDLKSGNLSDFNTLKDQRVVIAVDGESSRRLPVPSIRTGSPVGWAYSYSHTEKRET